ncbi:MAG: LacI family DNA-binding transcriptional regulator [Lachnospiraceae bacterium]|nr:LacI family DNA-binding transcriptional regulator [Lachnospiraceae bacterium]
MNNKVTIQDIADALGISRNTVSKAINNSSGLAEATRERILQKAVEMGYKSFSYAGAFSNVFSSSAEKNKEPEYMGEIALLSGTFLTQSHFASLMLDKMQQELSQLGYTLNTHRVSPLNLETKTLPLTLRLENVKAILCIEMFDLDYDNMLCGLGKPILFVDGPSKHNGKALWADQIYMDNTTEITRLVFNLLDKGYSRIGFVGDYTHCQSFYERYSAYYQALINAGQTPDPKYIIRNLASEDILKAIREMDRLPDVFLCANDFVALDLLAALKCIGKKVPDDVRVCGFDDSAESRMITPPLTTIHIHSQVTAFSAVQLLISRINEPSLDYRILHTQTDLIYRESCPEE